MENTEGLLLGSCPPTSHWPTFSPTSLPVPAGDLAPTKCQADWDGEQGLTLDETAELLLWGPSAFQILTGGCVCVCASVEGITALWYPASSPFYF